MAGSFGRTRIGGASPPPGASVHEVALKMLARRALSPQELKQRLLARGFERAVVAGEITRLRRLGMLDEAELARAVCREQVRRGFGRRGAAAALRRRRVARPEADEALAAMATQQEADALRTALAKAARRFPEYRHLPETRRKMVRYLLARGFRMADVLAVVSDAAGEPADAEETEEALEPGDPSDLP